MKDEVLEYGMKKRNSFDRMIAKVGEVDVSDTISNYVIRTIKAKRLLEDMYLNIEVTSFPDYYQSLDDGRIKIQRRIETYKHENTDIIYFAAYNHHDRPVGLTSITISEELEGIATLSGASVLPAYRGKGIYSQLLYHRQLYAEQNGIDYLHIFANRDTSAPIVAGKGFVVVERIGFYHYQRNRQLR